MILRSVDDIRSFVYCGEVMRAAPSYVPSYGDTGDVYDRDTGSMVSYVPERPSAGGVCVWLPFETEGGCKEAARLLGPLLRSVPLSVPLYAAMQYSKADGTIDSLLVPLFGPHRAEACLHPDLCLSIVDYLCEREDVDGIGVYVPTKGLSLPFIHISWSDLSLVPPALMEDAVEAVRTLLPGVGVGA